ncbi:unannotated protein [freshwater metagenome]|uniref:Unannotated protein n=1 Tax=freshwater metagenome TaxID=449393 RepID=A0A6J6BAT0_9ZZZZ
MNAIFLALKAAASACALSTPLVPISTIIKFALTPSKTLESSKRTDCVTTPLVKVQIAKSELESAAFAVGATESNGEAIAVAS